MVGMETTHIDVLVCGGGMSGMSCAAFASEAGAKVLVVEKQPHVGGSSIYSAGMFWAPRSFKDLRSWVPDGDADLQRRWLDDYFGAVQWMRQNGVPVADQYSPIMTIGIGYPIKIPELYRLHSRRIADTQSNSSVLTNAQVVQLLQQHPGVNGSRIIGAIIKHRPDQENESRYFKVLAKMVVLATGGFQGSTELRARYLGAGADNMFVRSNEGSVGDGLRLASLVGANTSNGMSTYYGHLLASPLRREDVNPSDFLALAQYQSRHCILINESGKRFADESTGDEVVNQYLAQQHNRRGFILFNEDIRKKFCVSSPFPNAGNIDRLAKARQHGCNVIQSPTLQGLYEALAPWNVDVTQAKKTVEGYRRATWERDTSVILDAPIGRGGVPAPALEEGKGPFYAMEVQPSITFTFGGISIGRTSHALTTDKTPIPGLLVAGVDAGGFSNLGYAGGLALAFVTGYWAAREAAGQLGLTVSQLPGASPEDLATIQESKIPSHL